MNGKLNFVSAYNEILHISFLYPDNWRISKTKNFTIVLIDKQKMGFMANLGFSQSEFAKPTAEGLQLEIDYIKKYQQQTYPDFQQKSEEKLFIDNNPAYLQIFNWHYEEEKSNLSNFFGMILQKDNTLLEINGSCLRELSDIYLPLFDKIVRSIRFIYMS